MLSLLHCLDGVGHDTPDLYRLPLFGQDVGVRWIGRLQLQVGTTFPKPFYSEFTVHHCDDNMAMACLYRPVDQHHIAVVDTGFSHGGATHTHQVRCQPVLDQDFVEVDTLAGVVFCW